MTQSVSIRCLKGKGYEMFSGLDTTALLSWMSLRSFSQSTVSFQAPAVDRSLVISGSVVSASVLGRFGVVLIDEATRVISVWVSWDN